MCFYFTLEFIIYLDLFSASVGIKICPCRICYECVQFQIELRKISHCGSRSPNNAEFGHFTLFCRGRQRNVQLRNRKHVPCFYRVIQTRVEVWENKKCCGNTSRRRVFPQLFRVLPNFHECLYNSIETRSTCFLFLLENNVTRKRKTTC